MFWMSVLPQTTQFMMNNAPLLGQLGQGGGPKDNNINRRGANSPYADLEEEDDDEDED